MQGSNEISIADLPAGIYTLRVTMENSKMFSNKVVKNSN
jgi:hypothetical protein